MSSICHLFVKAAGLPPDSQRHRCARRSADRLHVCLRLSSALLEAGAKFRRGLDQIATLPGTPTLRSQQIKLQVGLANALYHTKGFSAVETKAAFDQARAMIERER